MQHFKVTSYVKYAECAAYIGKKLTNVINLKFTDEINEISSVVSRVVQRFLIIVSFLIPNQMGFRL